MPLRRGQPLVPSEHMSVGGHHRQQHPSSGLLEAAASPYESRAETHHERYPPRVGRRNNQQGFQEFSQDSHEDEEDGTYVESDEEDVPRQPRKVNLQARKRKGQPKHQSKHAEKMAAIPGEASAKRKCKGKVQDLLGGGLEYWNETDGKWMPAVYHCQIRNKLIIMARTSRADVYRHPRARGTDASDVTAFLESQRDWDLERDNGWTGMELLFEFDDRRHERPSYEVPWMFDEGRVVLDLDNEPVNDYRDIPLTLSSVVEGALMEAIRRLDPRIRHFDFWARLPEHCKGGPVLTPTALSNRMYRFRLKNAVATWSKGDDGDRKGSGTLRQFLWDRMSPAARAANSTRELRKLSNKEQKQAKSGNAGKHAANAGGWAKNENESTQTVSIEASWEEGATRPAVSRSRKRKRQQKASISNNNGNEETWSLFDAPESSRQPRPEKRRRVREPAPSVIHAPQNPYAAPTDANAFIDPVLRSQPSVHDHGSSFGPSPGVYGILPTEAAVGAYDPFPESRRVQNGWDGPAGYDSGTQSMDTLARPWFHNQQTVQGAQLGMTYPPVGVEYTSNDTGVPNNPWYNGPHISPSARYQSSFQPVDLEGTLKQHLDANSAQRRSAEEDVEESFLRAGIRNLAYRTRPTESYPPREIDYRTVLPRGAEDRNDIQSALAKTKCNFRLRTKTECPPTDTDQSYSYQVKQVLGRFERWWGVNGGLDPTPDLIICQTPWRYGFASWEGPTGGDLEFVNARLQELRATRGGRP